MLTTFLGFFGALLILLAFILCQIHIWKDDSLIYDATNLLGSVILIIYGVLIGGWPFVALNSIWAVVSLRDTILDLKK